MADTDGNEWVLLDTDLTARVAILPSAMSHLYFVLNEPGSGELKIPLESNAAALIESGQFAQASYRGGARGGFFVDNIQKMQADASEGGGKWLSISGRGGLALLEDAIVWDDGTTASTREFASMTKAAILITLIDEAQARGGLAALTYDFSATDDSDSVAWTDSESYQLSVGTSVLDVLRQFAKTGIDFDIVYSSGSFVLSAYKNGKGSDKSETIYFRTGVNCEEVKSDERGDSIKNALRVAYKAGNVTITDGTSITNRRRREKLLDARLAQTAASATTYGSAILANSKDPRKGISVKIYDGVGPRVFLDYDIGDYIMLDVEGTETSYRVLGIQLDWDGKDYSNVVVELNTLLYENEIRMAQDIDWLLDQWETARDSNLIEASYWAGFGNPNDSVNCMVIDGNIMYIGGQFTIVGGISANRIAKYNISTGEWSALGDGLSNTYVGGTSECVAITVMGSNVYAGGNFATAGSTTVRGIAKWNGSTWSKVGTGPYGGFNNSVTCLANDGTTLYAGGNFTTFFIAADPFQTECSYVAKWNGSIWAAIPDTGLLSPSIAMDVDDTGDLWIGCGISGFPDYPTVKMWNGSIWTNLADMPDNRVYAVKAIGTDVYFGGPFENVGSLPALHIAKWDGLSWSALGDGLSGAPGGNYALGMASYLNDLYVVGKFTNQGNYIARWSGGSWWALGEGLGVNVYCVAVTDGKVYAGGEFATAGGKSSPNLAVFLTTFEAALEHLQNEAGNSFDMAAAIHRSTSVVPTDTSEVGIWYSVTNALAKVTFSNIWAYIKAKADLIYVALTGNQTIAGVKTFSSFPITPSSAPTVDYDVANKKYVDDNSGVPPVNPSAAGNLVSFADTAGGQADSGIVAANVLTGTGWPFNFARLLYTDTAGNVAVDNKLVYSDGDNILRIGGNEGSNNSNVAIGGNTGSASAPNSTVSLLRFITYGTTGTNTNLFKGTSSQGTKATPTASLADDFFAHFNGTGYTGTGNVEDVSSNGGMSVVANENWSATNRGTRLDFFSTPNTATAKVKAFTINSDGTVNIASGKTYNINGSPHTHSDLAGLSSANTFSAAQVISNTTDSVSTTTGSLSTAGGIGVAKNIVIGGSLGVGANPAYAIDAQRAGGADRLLLRFGITAVTNGLTVYYTHAGTIMTADLQGQMVIGSPTGGAKGAGSINAQAVYDDNVLLTDFVFEPEYKLLSIKETRKFYEKNLHLPTIPGRDEWEKKGSFSLGKLATHLWETVEVQARHIADLNDRLTALEEKLNKE